jgi:hypothetical protein
VEEQYKTKRVHGRRWQQSTIMNWSDRRRLKRIWESHMEYYEKERTLILWNLMNE